MAAGFDDVTADLEELVTCGICLEILQIPKTLSCLHTFCAQCLQDWYQQCQADRKPFQCPTCKTSIRLQGNDVNNLPTSFQHNSLIELYNTVKDKKIGDQQQLLPCFSCSDRRAVVAYCIQCGGMLCEECYTSHTKMKQFKETHQATLWNEFNKETINSFIDYNSFCQEKYHDEHHLECYCETCKKAICQLCAITAHTIHDKVSLEEASEKSQAGLKQEKHRLNEVIELYKNEQKLSCENRQRIEKQEREVAAKLLNDFQAANNILEEKKQSYRAMLKKYTRKQTVENDEEKKAIDNNLEQASSLRDQCEKMENLNLKQFVLEGHDEFEQVCQTTVRGTPILPTRPLDRYTSVRYVPNPEALQILRDLELAKIEVSVTDPSRCTIESVRDTRCGFVNQFNIITRDLKGNECHTDESLIDVQIQDIDGNHVNKEITQSQPGTYIVTYKASTASAYKLEVTIGGTPVSNSPQVAQTFDATAELKPVKVIKTPGEGRPKAVAVNDSGLIAVTFYNPTSAVLYNADGELLKEFGQDIAAVREARLHDPCGVAFTKNNCILITDNHDSHGMIKLYDISGNYKRLIHKEKGMEFIRMCTTNQTIACLAYNKNSKDSLIKLFSNPSCEQCLQDVTLDIHGVGHPLNIAYDSNKYFVTFRNSHSIHVFDERGLVLNTYGEKGDKEGQFNYPRGLAVFGADTLLVCDCNNHRVQLLHPDGRFISSFGSHGTGLGQMIKPGDVAVAPDGQVFVLEWGNRRLQVF